MTDRPSTSDSAGQADISVAAIVINFNGARDTARCLDSLRQSACPVSAFVVDNTPGDAELRRVISEFPDVALLDPGENLGFGRGNNLAIRHILENSDFQQILLLNNDAWIASETVQTLSESLIDEPDIGIAVPKIVLADQPDIAWYAGGRVDWTRGGSRVDGFLRPDSATGISVPVDVGFATGCAMLCRRQVFEQTAGFDPRFFMYEEDVEFSIRVRKLGWRIRFVPTAVVTHRVQGSMREPGQQLTGKWDINNPNFRFHAFHMTRNKLLNALIHARGMDAARFAVCFPIYLISKLMPHMLRLRVGAIMPVLQGLWSGFRAYRSGSIRAPK